MNISEQYKDLTTKINENLPLRAFPIRELVRKRLRDTIFPDF
jgi:hypothetical protein